MLLTLHIGFEFLEVIADATFICFCMSFISLECYSIMSTKIVLEGESCKEFLKSIFIVFIIYDFLVMCFHSCMMAFQS